MSSTEAEKTLECGLIMPISTIDGCTQEHWTEVKQIIVEAVNSIEEFEFNTKIVSEADDIGVIQKRIVQNVYQADIVICDVSAKNPNVMFELGMRLAFDKPTIIIKDDKTNYSFDTSIIEHLEYPRDLRFTNIVAFKNKLASKIIATHKKAISDPEHSTFLKNFGSFKVTKLDEKEVTANEAMLEILGDIQLDIALLKKNQKRSNNSLTNNDNAINLGLAGLPSLSKKAYMAIDSYFRANKLDDISELSDAQRLELYEFAEKYVSPREHFKSQDKYFAFMDSALRSYI